ncbi:Uncharacterized protein T07_1900 [Trichinella nelsoni]|uniref:Integrase catalytic domain-containing protein n=1 Tax=Trichinella nelsoni TaxID=6336 RepID=A0A0V0RVS7_9BILA|nr:Uncharacterized protein T07_1900 [Trichinella nelsoni]
MGDEHFQLLTNLVVLKDPTTMSFDECVSVLMDHYQPPELKKLSLNCAFDTHLPSALRDQFILGLHSDVIKRRLFLQPDMTFEKAVQLAQQMEAADQEMTAWRPTVEEAPADQSPATVHQTQGSVQRRVKQKQRAPAPTGRYKKSGCHRCSKLDYWASGYPHKNDRCRLCGPMLLHVEMNKVPVTMDLDTGAPCMYGTGQKLRTLGSCRVEMQLNGHKEKVDVFVIQAPGYPCLFGRDLLEKFLVDWKALKTMATTTTTTIKPLAINALSLTEVKGKFLKLGRATTTKAHLELRPDARAKFMKPRSVPFALKAKIENDLQRVVDMDVLQPITRSEWASLIVPVLKSDGQSGYAADWYPLLSNKDFFASLSGGTVFSRLDLSDAHLKIEMNETAKKCLVINTHKGLFQYNRLPFGVSCAPALFQHTMEPIMAGLEDMNCYLDDITVFGSSEKEHDERLFNLLKRLYAECFRLEASKHRSHQMLQRYVVCLGWLTTITSIVSPLYALLHENVVWSWKTACGKVWKALRTAFISLYVLMHYNSELPVRLECNACGYGIGAALSHVLPHGSHHPIAFASKTLSKAEKNYSQIERKALAPVFGVQKFHRYLFRRKFTLVTDYKPPTEHHANADYLSRNPIHVIKDECLQDATATAVVSIAFLEQDNIWWPRLDEDVELLAKTCTTCEVNQADPKRSLRLHMDFCGPMFNRIWLVVIEAMTKLPEVLCFKNYPTAGMLVEALQAIFTRFVYPEEIVTDNGSSFTSALFSHFCSSFGIRKRLMVPYHQATNGEAERFVRTFNEAMKKCSQLRQLHQEVQRFFLMYRTAQHLRTYVSLSELLMPRKIRTQWDLLKPVTVKKEKTTGKKVAHQRNESYRLHDKEEKVSADQLTLPSDHNTVPSSHTNIPLSFGPLSFTTKPSGSKEIQ